MTAERWKVPPSRLLGVSDKYLAFCLDECIALVMGWIEGEMEKVKGKNEAAVKRGRETKLRQLLSKPGDVRGRFADPALMLKG